MALNEGSIVSLRCLMGGLPYSLPADIDDIDESAEGFVVLDLFTHVAQFFQATKRKTKTETLHFHRI